MTSPRVMSSIWRLTSTGSASRSSTALRDAAQPIAFHGEAFFGDGFQRLAFGAFGFAAFVKWIAAFGRGARNGLGFFASVGEGKVGLQMHTALAAAGAVAYQ
jgi:hypothetical protein